MSGEIKRIGFSLVELMIVIIILTVLASIMLPVVTQAKIRAKKAASISNIRQQSLAAIQYAADYEGNFPWALGANCFSLGYKFERNCGELSSTEIKMMKPSTQLLFAYGVDREISRSPLDRMSPLLLSEGGHEATWWQETTTTSWFGSSFEYAAFNPLKKILHTSTDRVLLLHFSLFYVDGMRGEARQAGFSDGSARTLSREQFGKEMTFE